MYDSYGGSFDFSAILAEYYSSPAFIAGMICSIAVGVLMIIAYWKIFTKAGEPGWAAIVPFYNLYVLFKITRGNGWSFLLLLIPFANIVFLIILNFQLAKSFGQSGGFGVGLWLLPAIFYPILAFGNSAYVGPAK